MDEINRKNNEKFEPMKNEMENEIERIRNDFNSRMEGSAKKVDTKVSKTIEKELEVKDKVLKTALTKKYRT